MIKISGRVGKLNPMGLVVKFRSLLTEELKFCK